MGDEIKKVMKIRHEQLDEYNKNIDIVNSYVKPLIEYEPKVKKALHELVMLKTKLAIHDMVLLTVFSMEDMKTKMQSEMFKKFDPSKITEEQLNKAFGENTK
jgi:hypothetical protein